MGMNDDLCNRPVGNPAKNCNAQRGHLGPCAYSDTGIHPRPEHPECTCATLPREGMGSLHHASCECLDSDGRVKPISKRDLFAKVLSSGEHLELLMLIEQQGDPIERFISGLKDETTRDECKRTVRLFNELKEHMMGMCNPVLRSPPSIVRDREMQLQERLEHARWVGENAVEITYRWHVLMDVVQRWAALETMGSFAVKLP